MQRLASIYFNIPALRPGTVGAYAFALLCAGGATALRIAIDPYVTGVPFITFFPAVIIAALFSGFGASVFCIALSAAAADFFFMQPRFTFYIENPAAAFDLLLFIPMALLNAIIVTGMRFAIERCRQLSGTLEQRVEQRGSELAKVHERLEHDAMFRAMFDFSSVAKVESDYETGRFLRANAAMCEFVGYSEAELLAMTVFDITHPDERERDRALLQRLVAGQLPVFDMEKRYIRKDGRVVWARTTANIIRDASGRPLRYTVVIQDIGARKQAEQDLKASKDRLQLALEAAQLGSWQYDPLRRMFSGDTRSQEIFGIAENEASVEEVMKRVHPDDAEKVAAILAEMLDPTNPRRIATDFRVQRQGGGIRWVETLGLAYFEGAGRERRAVSIVGTVQDITERKEREEKERLLIREINHRAKNMLSVVHAIAHQTAAKNPEDFIERFSERIQALSANQDLLVRNEWKGVEIDDLVHAQLAHFAGLIGSRIAARGPKLRLNAASAQAIGLALHELATNAGKYGALSTDRGLVDICWDADGDTFTITWTERDGPVSPPKQRGFGTIVMEAMAERSVGGDVELDYAPSGVTWRLSCPAANALERR